MAMKTAARRISEENSDVVSGHNRSEDRAFDRATSAEKKPSKVEKPRVVSFMEDGTISYTKTIPFPKKDKKKQTQIYTADTLMYLAEVRLGFIIKRTLWAGIVMIVTSPKSLFDRATGRKTRRSPRRSSKSRT